MIDENVTRLAAEFSAFWLKILEPCNRYRCDFSWPSLGTVDLILSRYFRKAQLTAQDKRMMLGASAYIATIAHSCWKDFGEDQEAAIRFVDGATPEIVLEAREGKHLKKGELFRVPVTRALEQILLGQMPTLPVFARFERDYNFGTDLISAFGVGLCAGLCPYGDGEWRNLLETQAKEHIIATEFRLAKSSSEYYEKVFPGEALGAASGLYHSRLILPPLGYNEKFYGARAVHALQGYLKNLPAEVEEMKQVLNNLALFPNEQIASPAHILLLALEDKLPSDKVIYRNDSLGEDRILLKGALQFARLALEKPEPVERAQTGNLNEVVEMLRIEQALGFLPLVKMPFETLLGAPKLFACCYWSRAKEARRALDTYAEETKLSAELTLQGIFLDLFAGDVARAQREIQDQQKNAVLKQLSTPYLKARRDELLAQLALKMGDYEAASSYLKRTIAHEALAPAEQAMLQYQYARASFHLGQRENCQKALDDSLQTFPNLEAEIFKLDFLDEEAAQDKVQKLSRYAPRNKWLFARLIQNKMKQFLQD